MPLIRVFIRERSGLPPGGCETVEQLLAAGSVLNSSLAQAVLSSEVTPGGRGFRTRTAKRRLTVVAAERVPIGSEQEAPALGEEQVQPGELEAGSQVVLPGTVSAMTALAAPRLPALVSARL